MTYQEKRSFTYIITNLIAMTVYGLIVYNRFQAGNYEVDNLMKFWAVRILWYIPVIIGVRIVVEILLNIFQAISNEVQGKEQEDLGITDERDKLIEHKADRISMFLFAVGFVLALFSQVFDHSVHVFFITIIGFGTISEVVSELLKVRYYRRGV